MTRNLLFIFVFIFSGNLILQAQSLTIAELKQISQMPAEKIDTLLKRKNFRLLEKEKEDNLNLVYYTSLEKTPEGATWVRSITYIDAISKNAKGRLVTYRTYRKKEYQEMMAWLLNNNFHTASRTEMEGSTHTKYTDSKEEILFKVTKQKLPSGTMVLSYEVEVGG
jgi:hypothetical protein